jgi:lysophospholipase L1-like esterase
LYQLGPFSRLMPIAKEDYAWWGSRTLFLLILCSLTAISWAASHDRWVGTWAAAPFSGTDVHSDAAKAAYAKYGHSDTTFREIVHTSIGGSPVRVVFTNEFGIEPLTIGAGQVALSAGGSEIDLASAKPLTFGGQTSIVIPPGASAISDPADVKLLPFTNVAISLFISAQPISRVSVHDMAAQTNYQVPGNVVSKERLENPTEIYSWPFLKGLDVKAGGDGGSIVALGDSITDGHGSTRNANARWPDVLARRLQANKRTARLSVLNEGIGANRVLHDDLGPSALARFDRDVLAQAGVKFLIILESINDIGRATDPKVPSDIVSAQDLIAGLGQLTERAHVHGIRVIGATLTPIPAKGAPHPGREALRQAVNQWIRTTNALDGMVDFDKAVRDPTDPMDFRPGSDSGDHVHPSDAGYQAMGDAIDLKLFGAK